MYGGRRGGPLHICAHIVMLNQERGKHRLLMQRWRNTVVSNISVWWSFKIHLHGIKETRPVKTDQRNIKLLSTYFWPYIVSTRVFLYTSSHMLLSFLPSPLSLISRLWLVEAGGCQAPDWLRHSRVRSKWSLLFWPEAQRASRRPHCVLVCVMFTTSPSQQDSDTLAKQGSAS